MRGAGLLELLGSLPTQIQHRSKHLKTLGVQTPRCSLPEACVTAWEEREGGNGRSVTVILLIQVGIIKGDQSKATEEEEEKRERERAR